MFVNMAMCVCLYVCVCVCVLVAQFSSVQSLSHVSLLPHELQHSRPPCLSPTLGVHPNPGLLSQSVSHVQFFATPWTITCKPPLSMGFPRQEYWSWIAIPFSRGSPQPGG